MQKKVSIILFADNHALPPPCRLELILKVSKRKQIFSAFSSLILKSHRLFCYLLRHISVLGITWRVLKAAFPGSELTHWSQAESCPGTLALDDSTPVILSLSINVSEVCVCVFCTRCICSPWSSIAVAIECIILHLQMGFVFIVLLSFYWGACHGIAWSAGVRRTHAAMRREIQSYHPTKRWPLRLGIEMRQSDEILVPSLMGTKLG